MLTIQYSLLLYYALKRGTFIAPVVPIMSTIINLIIRGGLSDSYNGDDALLFLRITLDKFCDSNAVLP